eukprot:5319369-Pyramimonas_sp.AAC.1
MTRSVGIANADAANAGRANVGRDDVVHAAVDLELALLLERVIDVLGTLQRPREEPHLHQIWE